LEAGISKPPEIVESEASLRRRLADGQYIERSLIGEFSCCLKAIRAEKSAGNLTGMRSYFVRYLRASDLVPTFSVHFYLDDQGNVGASGLPDPKWIYEDGVIYTSNRRREAAPVT